MEEESEIELQDFLVNVANVPKSRVKSGLHLTLYEARRQLIGLKPFERAVSVNVEPSDWRFMVIAPGGENPRPDIIAESRPIGLRILKSAQAFEDIQDLRSEFYIYETP